MLYSCCDLCINRLAAKMCAILKIQCSAVLQEQLRGPWHYDCGP